MSEFLVVKKKVVTDKPAIPEQREVPEIPATEDKDGNVVTAAIPAIPYKAAIPAETHEEYDRAWVEKDAQKVAAALAAGDPLHDYYAIVISPVTLKATLSPVRVKEGPRKQAPAREVIEIEADGETVGELLQEVHDE